jgi:hypothetical protein
MSEVEKRKILDDLKKKGYPLETSEVKKCPNYGRELEEGFVNDPRGIYWDTEEHKWDIYTSKTLISSWSWAMPRVQA